MLCGGEAVSGPGGAGERLPRREVSLKGFLCEIKGESQGTEGWGLGERAGKHRFGGKTLGKGAGKG